MQPVLAGEINPAGLTRYSICDRNSLVSRGDILTPADVLSNPSRPSEEVCSQIAQLAKYIQVAKRKNRPVIFGVGAHVIKLGLGGLLADLARRKFITAVALNGAGAFHELELITYGETSEDVTATLGCGQFGMARESADMFNEAAVFAYENNIGLGKALAHSICTHAKPEYLKSSILVNAPLATVHLGIGTDVSNCHPSASGAALGASSLRDFRRLAFQVKHLNGGVYLNIGSAVMLPEVFLKAVACANNINSAPQKFITANMDFINQYRPRKNVLERITDAHLDIRARHEQTIPELYRQLVNS